MKSYQQSPSAQSKKAGMKRERSPYNPYKRKARGKENKPGNLGSGLSARVCGSATRARTRRKPDRYRRRAIEQAVRETVAKMLGTRRNPAFDRCPEKDPCDERLWANFAWATGDEKVLVELSRDALSEFKGSGGVRPDSDLPKILCDHIRAYCKKHHIDLKRKVKSKSEK